MFFKVRVCMQTSNIDVDVIYSFDSLLFSKKMDSELFQDSFLLSLVPKVTNQSLPQELAKYITVEEICQTWNNINNQYCVVVNQHSLFSEII